MPSRTKRQPNTNKRNRCKASFCSHQPYDIIFHANSYDRNRKPIAGRSQRLNTIRRDRTAAAWCSYDRDTTVVRALRNCRFVDSELVRQPYEFVRQPCEFAKLYCDCRTTAVRCSCVCHKNSQNAFSFMFLHASIFQTPSTFNFKFLLFLGDILSI